MHHGALLRQVCDLEKQDVVQIGKDYASSRLDEQDQAMLAFAIKINDAPQLLCKTDIEQLRQAGFTDEDILDIITSVAYRNFSNRLNIAIGLDDPENLFRLDLNLKAMLDAKTTRYIQTRRGARRVTASSAACPSPRRTQTRDARAVLRRAECGRKSAPEIYLPPSCAAGRACISRAAPASHPACVW